MTEEHKLKIKEGRDKAKKLREAGIVTKKKSAFDKPVVVYTGKEKDAFDFIPLIRSAFRKKHNYITHYEVIKEITDKRFWQNTQWILTTLERYVILEKKEEKRKRKPLTEAQYSAACERMRKAREARSKNTEGS